MNIRMELALAYDEGIDEGERRAGWRADMERAHAARLQSEVDRLTRLLRATQSRLAMRERLILGLLHYPEEFRQAATPPTED